MLRHARAERLLPNVSPVSHFAGRRAPCPGLKLRRLVTNYLRRDRRRQGFAGAAVADHGDGLILPYFTRWRCIKIRALAAAHGSENLEPQ